MALFGCGNQTSSGSHCLTEMQGAAGFSYYLKGPEPVIGRVLRAGPPSPSELAVIMRGGEARYVEDFVEGRITLVLSEYIVQNKSGISVPKMRTGLRAVATERYASYARLDQLWRQASRKSRHTSVEGCLRAWDECLCELDDEWARIDARYAQVIWGAIGIESRVGDQGLREVDLLASYPE
ncbi:MAG: hypothetical protein KDB73_05075 [Planctomycetes bacterium]|nr:hypothetical protein [Planctomycetota bacterium]